MRTNAKQVSLQSHAYPALWTRCDVRNAVGEAGEFPESLTDSLSSLGEAQAAARAQPMHTLDELVIGCDVVVNLAAEHRDDVTPKSLYDEVNVQGAHNVCEVCAKYAVKKIIFTSSVAVYGFAPVGTDEAGKIAPFKTTTAEPSGLLKRSTAGGKKRIHLAHW